MTRTVIYKPRSWHDYNKSLIQRGNLCLWVDDELLGHWRAAQSERRGAPRKYSDLAIKSILKLKYLFNLTLRAAQGFIQSLFYLLKVELPVPSYSTLSRRLRQLEVELDTPESTSPISLAIDSSGLKVYGEGEWKVRIHGYSKRRTWRKFHLGIDVDKQMIHGVTVTTNDFKDNEVFEDTTSQVNAPIEDILGDGAYDSKNCYEACIRRKANPIFPPRKGAVIHQHGNYKKESLPRDQAVRDIRALGKKGWKEKVRYHRRSLAETAMFRFKKLFTAELNSRTFMNQAQEVFIKCNILNQFNGLGLANSRACSR
jgi:hypothetical protein